MQFSKTIFFISILFFPLLSFAKAPYTIKLINHYSEALDVTAGINPEVLPGFPKQFTLEVNEERESEVADIQKRAFVNTRDMSTHKNYTFWAVGIEEDYVRIWPYEARKIAFSVKKNVIVFCTPEEYQKHHSCFTA